MDEVNCNGNIFDLSNLDDVDSAVVAQLPKRLVLTNLVLSLFDLKEHLNIAEIMVALYRQYQIKNIKKSHITTCLNRLLKTEKIERISHGVYTKKQINVNYLISSDLHQNTTIHPI